MFKQHLVFAGLLASALGIPYAASEWRQILDFVTAPSASGPRESSAEAIELQRSWEKTQTIINDTSWQNSPAKSGVFRNVSDSAGATYTDQANAVQDRIDQASKRAIDGYDQAQKNLGSEAKSWNAGNPGGAASGTSSGKVVNVGQSGEPAVGFRTTDPVPGPKAQELAIVGLEEALNLDMTQQYILYRWPRVNTGLIEGDLRGYRVPFVTGSNEDDPAGALTFYFDKLHRCARITFSGTVGNPQRLVMFLVQRYGFGPKNSTEPGVHVYEGHRGSKPNLLTIRPAKMVRASAPHLRYEVELELSRK